MPGIDGLTVIREARRLKADIPVIIITGFSTEASAIEAVNLGVSGYLDQALPRATRPGGGGEGARRVNGRRSQFCTALHPLSRRFLQISVGPRLSGLYRLTVELPCPTVELVSVT